MISISAYEFVTLLVAGAAILTSLVVASLLTFRPATSEVKLAGPRERWARGFLSLLLLVASLTVFGTVLGSVDLPEGWDTLNYALPFLYYTLWFSPLIYLYARAKLEPTFTLRWRDALHLILPLAQTSFYVYLLIIRGYATATEWPAVYITILQAELYVYTVSSALYLFAALRRVRVATRDRSSETLLWLERFIRAALAVVFAIFLFELIYRFAQQRYRLELYRYDWFEEPQTILYSAILFWIAFNGYMAHRTQEKQPRRKERYNLEVEEISDLSGRLDALMKTERPYLEADLNLTSLAAQLGVSPKELSLIINEGKGMSFNDYVNGYRVEETKRLLKGGEQGSLLDVAFDAGFNSKATFNRVFKQATGQTPSEYRAALRREQLSRA